MTEALVTNHKFVEELQSNGVVQISYRHGNTVHAYTTASQMDSYITAKYGSCDFLKWSMQRPIDSEKVDVIIEVEKNQLRRFGCITSSVACQISTISGEEPVMSDGQHRFEALRTDEEGNLAKQKILIIFTDFPSEEDRFMYFKNINENTPLPSIYKEHSKNFFRCIMVNCVKPIDDWMKTESSELSRFQYETGIKLEITKIKERLFIVCDKYTRMGVVIKEDLAERFVKELVSVNNKLKAQTVGFYPKFVLTNACTHPKKKDSGFQCTAPRTNGDRCGKHYYEKCNCSKGKKCDNADHKTITTRLIRKTMFDLIGTTLPILMFQDYDWIEEVFKHMYSPLL